MTNHLVGDVYEKIIEEVIATSSDAFEESGVNSQVLQDLQKEWQTKLSRRGVASMPWDPKPMTVQQSPNPGTAAPSAATNGLPPISYPQYDAKQAAGINGGPQIKNEPGAESQYYGPSNTYAQQGVHQQGGLARAQQLVQEYGGQATNASVHTARGGLALPGQPSRPQSLQSPAPDHSPIPSGYSPAQQQEMQQQRLQQQQAQPRIKVENDNSQVHHGRFQPQQHQQPSSAYAQTDGADDGLDEWQAMIAQRRAITVEQTVQADRMIRESVKQSSLDLESGLMLPFDERSKHSSRRKCKIPTAAMEDLAVADPSVSQLDGVIDDEDEKPDVKDDDDENAINSDLDDSDEEGQGPMGDEDEENGDTILCTYDKVQRVKNKWKCTLKDGVMSVGGKEWVFHKGMGEFEW